MAHVVCPKCTHKLDVPDSANTLRVRCRKCSHVFLYSDKDEYDRAIADYTKAIALNPDDADTYYNRAITYSIKRDYQKAWVDVRTCRRLGGQVNPKMIELLTKASGRSE